MVAAARALIRAMASGIATAETAPNAACDQRTDVKSPPLVAADAHGFQSAETTKPVPSKRFA